MNPGSFRDYQDCTGQVAVIMMHGSEDTIMPVESTAPSRYYWIAINSCSKEETEEGFDPVCDVYSSCDSDFPVEYCEHSGGHDWPDFASDPIWDFFKGLTVVEPSEETGTGDIEELGKGTISFKVLILKILWVPPTSWHWPSMIMTALSPSPDLLHIYWILKFPPVSTRLVKLQIMMLWR